MDNNIEHRNKAPSSKKPKNHFWVKPYSTGKEGAENPLVKKYGKFTGDVLATLLHGRSEESRNLIRSILSGQTSEASSPKEGHTSDKQYRDSEDSDKEDDWGSQPINTYELSDNCYYVCVAKLLNTTTDKLVKMTGIMQERTGTLSEVSALLEAVGKKGNYKDAISIDDVEEQIHEWSQGLSKNFLLGYHRVNNSGHAIIVHYNAAKQICEYKDYQVDTNGAKWSENKSNIKIYHLFES